MNTTTTNKYRRINNIVNDSTGTFIGLTTKNYTGTVNVVNISAHYVTVKPVKSKTPLKIHKNSILKLTGFRGTYNRKFANSRFQ